MRWIEMSLLIFLISGGHIFGQTYVSGPVDRDTTWTSEHSPYIVTEDLIITKGATLTIKPEVTIYTNNHARIIVEGALIAIGTSKEKPDIVFSTRNHWGGIWFRPASSGIIKHCFIEESGYFAIVIDRSSPSIIGNELYYNNAGIDLRLSSSLIQDNIIKGTGGGSGIFINSSPCTLIGNTITNHEQDRWSVGIAVGGPPLPEKMHFNNFYDNLSNIRYCIEEGDTLDARYNWWGSSDEDEIKLLFYDWGCGGVLLYKPWLESPYTAVERTTWGEIKARYR